MQSWVAEKGTDTTVSARVRPQGAPWPPEPQIFRLRDAFWAAPPGLLGSGCAISSPPLQLWLLGPESDSETLSIARPPKRARRLLFTHCNPQASRIGFAMMSCPASLSTSRSVSNGERGKEPSSSDTPSFEGNRLLEALYRLQRRGVLRPDRSSEGVCDTWGVCSLSRQKVWGSQLGRVWWRGPASSAQLLRRQLLCLLPWAPLGPLSGAVPRPHWPSLWRWPVGTTDCYLRSSWGFTAQPGEVCVVKTYFCVYASIARLGVWVLFFFSVRGPSHTGGCPYLLSPKRVLSSTVGSVLPDTAQENPEKSIRLASPRRGAAASTQEGAGRGVESRVWAGNF